MKAAICWGKRIIARTTPTEDQRRTLPSSLPLTAHCLARCCCQNPTPIKAMDSPKNHGRDLVKKALAVPKPTAASEASGRQQPSVTMALRIALKDAETPVACFMCVPLHELSRRRRESIQREEDQSGPNRDTDGSSEQSLPSKPKDPRHRGR